MKQALLQIALVLPIALCVGCGGHYVLSAGDQLATTDDTLAIVARIQHNELRSVNVPVENQTISVRLYPRGTAKSDTQTSDEIPTRSREYGAISNDDGYISLQIPLDERPVYNKPGKYDLKLSLQSRFGDEQFAVVPVYVLSKTRPLIAVDLDALPANSFFDRGSEPAKALTQIAQHANLVYYATHAGATRQRIHAELMGGGYPDGAVLRWQPRGWQVTRTKQFNLDNVPTISRSRTLENNLDAVAKQFPKFQYAITSRYIAANAFAKAGLDAFVVGMPLSGDIINVSDWPTLAKDVLAKLGHTPSLPPQQIRGMDQTQPAPKSVAPVRMTDLDSNGKPAPAPLAPAPAPVVDPAKPTLSAPIRITDLKPETRK